VVDQHGVPEAGIVVTVQSDVQSQSFDSPPQAITDALGHYTVTGVAPGKNLTACFMNPNSESGASCYKDKSVYESPTTFTVVAGKVTSGIDGEVKD
jgi:hypothetical protein